MSDLTFNKVAGAVLATGLAIVGLRELSSGVFSQEKVEKPGYAVEVVDDSAGGAAVADVPPDWGTVLPTADVAAGEAVFQKCKSCHSAEQGGPNGTGPDLWGVEGRKPGSHPGFAYSAGMTEFGSKQPIWDYEHIYEFVKNPQKYIPGTKMTFVGLKQPQDRINVIAYLHSKGCRSRRRTRRRPPLRLRRRQRLPARLRPPARRKPASPPPPPRRLRRPRPRPRPPRSS